MKGKILVLILNLFVCTSIFSAEEKSDLQTRAESEAKKGNIANARSLFIRALDDYFGKGMIQQGVECGTKATALYYKENLYKEAFELLRHIDQGVYAARLSESQIAALRYYTVKERMQMYIKLRKSDKAKEQLEIMEKHVNLANDDNLQNDLLYNKAIYYFTFGQNTQGNAVFKEMASRLTAQKDYEKVDEVYQTLIANGRKSNNASLVAQSYSSYMVWKDSVNALKAADEVKALNQKISDNENVIAEKDDSLATSRHIIIALCVFAAILAAVLLLGAIVLLRFVFLTRKQKNIIKTMKENNELKVQFINNISSHLQPTLQKLDQQKKEVKALIKFTEDIQLLSTLENSLDKKAEFEETAIQPFCEQLMEKIKDKVKADVELILNVPKMTIKINTEYVSHILLHILNNAAVYTPAEGHIRLEFKKRGAHTHQFIVTNTGSDIPSEKQEDIFKPFLYIHDLTDGDGLGLPICKQMALKMDGDLKIDPEFCKGTRFVLSLHD